MNYSTRKHLAQCLAHSKCSLNTGSLPPCTVRKTTLKAVSFSLVRRNKLSQVVALGSQPSCCSSRLSAVAQHWLCFCWGRASMSCTQRPLRSGVACLLPFSVSSSSHDGSPKLLSLSLFPPHQEPSTYHLSLLWDGQPPGRACSREPGRYPRRVAS